MLDLLNTKKAATLSPLANGSPASQQSIDGIVAVPLCQILDNPYQPRSNYDAEHILNLALSIKRLKRDLPATAGLQQVPLARLGLIQRDGSVDVASRALYERGRAQRAIHEERNAVAQLMFGHSRLRAFMVLAEGLRSLLRSKGASIGMDFTKVADIETTYAELLDADGDYVVMPLTLGFALDHSMWRHAITENSQRKNITAIEEAQSLQRAMEEFGLSTEEAGKPFGYARSTAANKLRLLSLPTEVQRQIAEGLLTERHGRELLRVAADPERVKKLADKAAKSGLTVRQLTESVTWEERKLKEEQEKERQLAVIRQQLAAGWQTPMGASMPANRVSDLGYYQVNQFGRNDPKDRILVEQGGCGPHCDCFVLVYMEFGFEQGYRPDPDNAPNVCLACSDSKCHYDQRSALGDVKADDTDDAARARQAEAAEKKRKVEQVNNEAHTVWQRWLREQDKHALWNSIAFWHVVARFTWQIEPILKAADVQTACAEMLNLMYRSTRDYDQDLGDYVHTVANVQKLIKSLGGVSRETDEYAGIEQVIEEGEDT
ncbi:MAG TPA: hypothetical protein PKA43_00275 [Candidatus Competibacter phosphatis]|nr:hypothetical protein [Candidatus Competibacter phosphatis]